MVIYHTAFDLEYFWSWPVLRSLGVGGWILARTSAVLFLLVAGICFTLSWERTSPPHRLQKTAKRFLILALSAALVSAATWLIAPQDFIKFGILHLFALATLLLPLFAPLKLWNALPALLIILIPTLKNTNTLTLPPTPYPLLVLLGSPPPGFSSLDYFPLLPWFGVLLLGSAIGHAKYFHHAPQRSKAAYPLSPRERVRVRGSSLWRSVGRHSLIIYLLHQPALLGVLSLLHTIFQTRAG